MEKKRRFIITSLYLLTIAAVVILVFKYVILNALPFIFGFGLAALLNPVVRFLSGKFSMKARPTSILILVLFYGTVGTLASLIFIGATVRLGEFSERLPSIYRQSVEPALGAILEWVNTLADRIGGQGSDELANALGGLIEGIKGSLGTAVSNVSVKVIAWLSGFAAAVPRFAIGLVFSVIASFFFIVDYENILKTLKSLLPERTVGIMSEVRTRFFVTLFKYLRSYFLILLITFAELFFGLVLIGVENAAIYALIISLLDILPVLGTGAVLVPWAILRFFAGAVAEGVGLLILWGAVTVIRNIIEPRIVGRQVGLHPLVTLIAIFIGTRLFGFLGLILLPVLLAALASLVREKIRKGASRADFQA